MRHAVLGAGSVGGLLAGALARAGTPVRLVMRPETLARYGGALTIESPVLGDFRQEIPAGDGLTGPLDVVWVCVKAPALGAALELVPDVGDALVVPVLNGIDHVAALRTRYERVVPATVRVEAERGAPFEVIQRSPFLHFQLARASGVSEVAEDLVSADISCGIQDDEQTLLWTKLTFLAPLALATTALGASVGMVRDNSIFQACLAEALAVAHADGAAVDDSAVRDTVAGLPNQMRTSMQKDVEARLEPETDALAGAIVRRGATYGIATPATQILAERVLARYNALAP